MWFHLPVLMLGFAVLGSGEVRANEPKKDPPKDVAIEFENMADAKGQKVVLGPVSAKRFRETVNGKVSDFDPKFLKKSRPMGLFVEGKEKYEFHVDILVHVSNKGIKIWSSKLTRELTEAMLKEDGSWKTLLAK